MFTILFHPLLPLFTQTFSSNPNLFPLSFLRHHLFPSLLLSTSSSANVISPFFLPIVAGQEEDVQSDDLTKVLCSNKGPGEWFRLAVTDCRDVIQCTEAVSVSLLL